MEQQVRVMPDQEGARVISCAGEFDLDTLGPLEAACSAAGADPGVRRIVLDVAALTYADSSFLNLMLRVLRTGRLVVAGPVPSQLARVLDLTETRSVFRIADDIASARTL
ncbi:STAS domain-containing protein [Streptomyces sp. NPDC029003]|uniref:STAS domain-containing protein n=1 Tax=Streptomyces sp. NPDC029003 TaxID=3155125 RepID=UPI0033D5DB47